MTAIDTTTVDDSAAPAPASERVAARRENWRLIRRRPAFIIGLIILVFWVFCAFFGESVVPNDPYDFNTVQYAKPIGSFPFGTDKTGRDVFSRVIVGSREVLKTAPLAAFIGVFARRHPRDVHGLHRTAGSTRSLGRVVEALLALPPS